MSGGYFGYNQDQVKYLANDIERIAEYQAYNFTPETFERMKEAVYCLRKAYVYVQNIDWLLSGDDSEDTFHERLKKELGEV